MALQTSIQNRVLRGDLNPETWTRSQYCEYRPSDTVRAVLKMRPRE